MLGETLEQHNSRPVTGIQETTTHQRTQGAISKELQQSRAPSWSQSRDSAGAGAEGKDTAAFTESVFGSSIEHAILRPSTQSEQLSARTPQDKLTSKLPLLPQRTS